MSTRQFLARLALLVVLFGTAGYLFWNWIESNRPENRYRAGVDAIEESEYDHAEAIADRLDRSNSHDWAHLLRGRSLLKQTRYSKALDEFHKIKGEGIVRREGVYYSGEALLKVGRLREAETAFLFVLSEDPDHVEAHRQLAVLYYDQGDSLQAIAQLDEVIRLDPRDGRPHSLAGVIFVQTDQHPLAVEEFRKALAGDLPDPLREETSISLGESLLKLFRHDEAVEAVQGIDSPRAALVRAAVLTRQNRFADALAELKPWLERNPDDPRLLRQKGITYLAEDRSREAIPFLERAAELEPSDYPGQYQLGEALARAGEVEKAAAQRKRAEEIREKIRQIVDLSEAAAKNPWDAEPRLKLAELWAELGKPELSLLWRKAAAACREAGSR